MTYPTTITARPGLPFLDVVREFDAPTEAVFRAHTDPTLFAQWMGPRETPMEGVVLEPTTGGRWKYEFRGSDSPDPMSFFGVFHTVQPNTLIVQTFEFSLAPGHAGISFSTFEDLGGRTRLSVHEVYQSLADRDAATASGMEYGIIEGYTRLDELLVGEPLLK